MCVDHIQKRLSVESKQTFGVSGVTIQLQNPRVTFLLPVVLGRVIVRPPRNLSRAVMCNDVENRSVCCLTYLGRGQLRPRDEPAKARLVSDRKQARQGRCNTVGKAASAALNSRPRSVTYLGLPATALALTDPHLVGTELDEPNDQGEDVLAGEQRTVTAPTRGPTPHRIEAAATASPVSPFKYCIIR
jgi:hypothetical protein